MNGDGTENVAPNLNTETESNQMMMDSSDSAKPAFAGVREDSLSGGLGSSAAVAAASASSSAVLLAPAACVLSDSNQMMTD